MSDRDIHTAIQLLTRLDRIRYEIRCTIHALQPYAELHPYLATRLDRLNALLDQDDTP